MNLSTLKKEAREEFRLKLAGNVDLDDGDNVTMRWDEWKQEIDQLLDKATDVIEGEVVPEPRGLGFGDTEIDKNEAGGFNECRMAVADAFQAFRNEKSHD